MSAVVFERLPPADYASGCVALGREYGTPAWEASPETAAIRTAVFTALDRLDAETGVASRLAGKAVLVKPNLVVVYNDIGLGRVPSPETTDPRVLDAVVCWLAPRCAKVVIVESSGRGSPTRASFALSGIDRLARHRGCGLVALEEEPVDRYFLPRAQIQKEILVPRIFSAVVRGEAAYVSVPKLKTNLYTGVTLGFKNAMGVIPYNLRQRDHDRSIDRKLVEMLYLFKPDIVVIDGVVGGEGECPAPVDPVDSRAIIAGDHAVETDRAATRFMGFDPDSMGLIRIADELGFRDPAGARIVGDDEPVRFRPADASLVSTRVRARFPRLTVLYGLDLDAEACAGLGSGIGVSGSPTRSGASLQPDPPAALLRMEASCRGGCVASTRFGLAMLEAEGMTFRHPALLAIGPGIDREGRRLWFDAEGVAWDQRAIGEFRGPKAAIGSCGARLAGSVDWFAAGCMPLANAPHAILHRLSGTRCALLSARNRHLWLLARSLVAMRRARIRLIRSGERLDVEFPVGCRAMPASAAVSAPPWAPEGASWVPWPMEPIRDRAEARLLIAREDDLAMASFTGVIKPAALRPER